jgi:hypothetical protein
MCSNFICHGFCANNDRPNLVEINLESALDGGALEDAIDPSIEMRVGCFVWISKSEHLEPRQAGDIGDGVVVGEILTSIQMTIEKSSQVFNFLAVSLDRIFKRFGRILNEMVKLTHHRSEVAQLPRKPLMRERLLGGIRGNQPACFFGEVEQYRARLPNVRAWGIGISSCVFRTADTTHSDN